MTSAQPLLIVSKSQASSCSTEQLYKIELINSTAKLDLFKNNGSQDIDFIN
jgi:hypothetical protein